MIGENLDFDVAGALEIFFEVHARIAESVLRFGGGIAPGGGEIAFAVDAAHAFAAAAGDGFQNDGKADFAGDFGELGDILDGIERAGDRGGADCFGDAASGSFRAELLHGFGGRADESDLGFAAGARQGGIFGEETVAGMDSVAVGVAGDAQNFFDD